MKVFLSHQRHDSDLASRIARRLETVHGIISYLDIVDPYVGGGIDALADHIRAEMGKCTQLLAVVSPTTAQSQWVPWEIGVATEKDYPLATFAGGGALPPEFLRKWPYLRTDQDLDEYAKASKSAVTAYRAKAAYLSESRARAGSTRDFHVALKSALGQK